MDSTAPGFLIAMPALQDPNFDRTVVLMLEHNKEGAVGLVINRPYPGDPNELAEKLGIAWRQGMPGDIRVGGPVHTRSGWLVHPTQTTYGCTQIITDDIAISTSREALEDLTHQTTTPFRLLLGYAGWGPGQLEREMSEGAWLLAPMVAGLIFETAPDQMYDRALALLGITRSSLAAPSTGIN